MCYESGHSSDRAGSIINLTHLDSSKSTTTSFSLLIPKKKKEKKGKDHFRFIPFLLPLNNQYLFSRESRQLSQQLAPLRKKKNQNKLIDK